MRGGLEEAGVAGEEGWRRHVRARERGRGEEQGHIRLLYVAWPTRSPSPAQAHLRNMQAGNYAPFVFRSVVFGNPGGNKTVMRSQVSGEGEGQGGGEEAQQGTPGRR